jgi:hypothetical protein
MACVTALYFVPSGAEGVVVEERTLDTNLESWIAELGDRTSVSASAVQDHLIDLWGVLPEGEGRRLVEEWLVETLARELYRTDDVIGRLRGLPDLGDDGIPSSPLA